jgi:superfamily II DNA or RNA helicase
MFELTEDDVFDITGSEDMEKIVNGTVASKIYLVNHQTIASYAKTHGWNGVKEFFDLSSICVKVFDESHKFFENALMIDYFSNVSYTYYLTATFARSDARESAIYKSVYSSVKRFGEETLNYEEKRKHIVFVAMYYHTSPTLQDKNSMNTLHGFSSYKFIDYALKEESNTLMRVIEHILSSTSNLKGSTLIISPKIDSCEYIANEIKKFTDKSVGTVHSRNSKEENEKNIKKDIICSTIKSIGEGDDIRNLRILINTEPLGSRSLADQLRGRLREFSKTDDTFMFYPIDTSISETTLFFKRILPVMKKKCKEIIITKFSD